ncbi:MAG: cobalt-precorrin-6A reductase [Magnetospirillum sp. WYHS-4]
MPKKVLILGGTAQANELAALAHERLAGRAEVVLSLAGVAAPRRSHPCIVRKGGFGGIDGLADYLKAEGVTLVVDATHPFAEQMSNHAYCACLEAGTSRLALVRPPWHPEPGDRWVEVESFARAAEVLPRFARRVLLTTGRRDLGAFAGLPGIFFAVRLLEAPAEALPLDAYRIVVGAPPHSVEDERRLMRDLRIDTLITKQSGGEEGRAKLVAAREERVKVVLIARPYPEPGPQVATVAEAMAWVEAQL